MTYGAHRPKAAVTEHRPQNFNMVAITLSAAEPVVWQVTAVPGPQAPEFETIFASGTVLPEVGDVIVLTNQLIREQRVVVAYVEPYQMELSTDGDFTVDIWNIYVRKEG